MLETQDLIPGPYLDPAGPGEVGRFLRRGLDKEHGNAMRHFLPRLELSGMIGKQWISVGAHILIISDFLSWAENALAHLGCLSGEFIDQPRTGFRVAEGALG